MGRVGDDVRVAQSRATMTSEDVAGQIGQPGHGHLPGANELLQVGVEADTDQSVGRGSFQPATRLSCL